ncbi:nuclear transport factor 2 family protein [Nocardioides sp. LS1]|uniref:nuclear transport factor 2 family protein n=1 Tax=Nocardioides sp. LS1 TaxID=1027620 RepID=UPI000F62832B|nr:nuclear transport factor 2 family protein [Nocardioides sp. LS1]GCD91148.1 polyketide cyclase [Nocardioides sp. LS1]
MFAENVEDAPSRGPDERVRDLEDRFAICELKTRYFRAVDSHDWSLLESLFVPDATFSTGGAPHSGAARWTEHVSKFMGDTWSAHHGHTPEISLDGDVASAIWPMVGYLLRHSGSGYAQYGHYAETYQRTSDGWRISSLAVRHQREEHDLSSIAP